MELTKKLESYFTDIKTRTDETRNKAALEIRQLFETYYCDSTTDVQIKIINPISEKIQKFLRSSDNTERRTAMILLYNLVDLEINDYGFKSQCLKGICNFLPPSDQGLMELNASLLVKFSFNGLLSSDMFDFEMKKAKVFLHEDNVDRKLYALILFRECSRHIPTVYFSYIFDSFQEFCSCLHDSRLLIRETALSLLKNCLAIFVPRENRIPKISNSYEVLYKAISVCLEAEGSRHFQDDVIISCLGALNEIVRMCSASAQAVADDLLQSFTSDIKLDRNIDVQQTPSPRLTSSHLLKRPIFNEITTPSVPLHSQICQEIIGKRYKTIIVILLKYCSHKNQHISQLATFIISLLCSHNSSIFVNCYLTQFMDSIFSLFNNLRERGYLFISLAMLANLLKDYMEEHIYKILKFSVSLIPNSKSSIKQRSEIIDPAIIGCLCSLAPLCVGTNAKLLHEIIRNIIEYSRLTPAVVTFLVRSSDKIHNYQNLVVALVPILSEKILKKSAQESRVPSDPKLVVLALRTIRALEIIDYHIKEDFYYSAQMFLASTDKIVRLEAAKTCCHLLSLMPRQNADTLLYPAENNKFSRRTLLTLKKLVVAGISDPEPDIRLCILSSLSEYNEDQLSNLELLRILSLGLRDEFIPVREVIISLLGRLSSHHPAYIIPLLDQHLVECLAELNFRNVSNTAYASAHLLCCLVSSTPRMSMACMFPVLNVILPCLNDLSLSNEFIVALLATLSDLSFFCGPRMCDYMPTLFFEFKNILASDEMSSKKSAALNCLVLTVRHTGFFIENDEIYVSFIEVLFNLLSGKHGKKIRRQVLNAFGALGARDYYRFRNQLDRGALPSTQSLEFSVRSWESSLSSYNVFELLQHYSSTNRLEEFYAGVCIDNLMQVLTDVSLTAYHSLAVQVVENICVSLSKECHRYLSLIFPTYIRVVRVCDVDMQRILLDQISKLIPLARNRSRPYVDDLFTLIDKIWNSSTPLSVQMKIIKVVQHLMCFLPEEASRRIPLVISRLIKTFQTTGEEYESTEFDQFSMIFLTALQHMGPFLRDHLFVVVPALIQGFDSDDRRLELQKLAIATLQTLFLSNDLQDFVVPILQALLRGIAEKPSLRASITGLLIILFEHAPVNMKVFVPTIVRTLSQHKTENSDLEAIISFVRSCPEHQLETEAFHRMSRSLAGLHPQKREELDSVSSSPNVGSNSNLVRACQTSQRVSKEEWNDWLSQLSLELVKEAPSAVLRACSSISQAYSPLGRQLFAFSFFSCWRELNHSTREVVVKSFVHALESADAIEVVPTILALAEFMEHVTCDPLPLPHLKLAACAYRAAEYAKALRYTELALTENQDFDVLQSLISYNTLLNNADAAQGVLVYAERLKLVDLALQQRWFESLHDFKNALNAYNKQLEIHPRDHDLILGKMQCLEALCEWTDLESLVKEHWSNTQDNQRLEMARMGSLCAIGLGRWESLQFYSDFLPKQNLDSSIFQVISELRSGKLEKAKNLLENTRSVLENELSGAIFDSYERSYRPLFTCQILSELDEMIDFQLFPAHRPTIKVLWEKRLRNCKRVISDWHRLLDMHAIVLEPKDDLVSWLKLASLCRKESRHSLCQNIFSRLLTPSQIASFSSRVLPEVHPFLCLSYLRHMWATGKQLEAFALLDQLVTTILPQSLTKDPSSSELSAILSKAHLQLGLWTMSGVLGLQDVSLARENFVSATEYGPESYKAWNAWAKINYEIVMRFKHDNICPSSLLQEIDLNTLGISRQVAKVYAVPSILALFRSVELSETNTFQDTLRLLTLWFDFGEFAEVCETIENKLESVKLETWLQVVPQLIARIDTPKTRVRRMIQQLLVRVGCRHPQALIYPLMVSITSTGDMRSLAVSEVLKSLSDNYPGLVEQANTIRTELIRVSILWCEAICVHIDQASKLFFNEKDIPGTLTILDNIHSLVNREAQTPCEKSFLQSYGDILSQALLFRKNYTKSNDVKDLLQAWSLYYNLYRRLSRQVTQIKTVDLQHASPKLLSCRDLILPIPGTYQPHVAAVCIHSLEPSLKVMGSKQKPRRCAIRGNDGQRYEFLLKGHEDLRQDERVMQLFGLLNNLLLNCQETFVRRLEIHRYAVVPLSTESGLIGWVPNTDTLHALLKEYRQSKGLNLSLENAMLAKTCPQYECLDLLHKVEIFEHIALSTPDDHLALSLWKKSINSEVWLKKRTNFTRSLALMSMVGYILGLGDRHPSNIMQDRVTGRIIHIDFGDCFEVAIRREKFPERVPFRLTRMLTKCMEVTGIDGTFKVTSIHVMELLREHKDSLLAVLEAFVHDPLLNWRLLESKNVDISPSAALQMGEKGSDKEFLSSSITYSHSRSSKSIDHINPSQLKSVALGVIRRVKDKLSGTDFEAGTVVDVRTQVELLIDQATSIENLSQGYIGW